jgi:hypothetical protein
LALGVGPAAKDLWARPLAESSTFGRAEPLKVRNPTAREAVELDKRSRTAKRTPSNPENDFILAQPSFTAWDLANSPDDD